MDCCCCCCWIPWQIDSIRVEICLDLIIQITSPKFVHFEESCERDPSLVWKRLKKMHSIPSYQSPMCNAIMIPLHLVLHRTRLIEPCPQSWILLHICVGCWQGRPVNQSKKHHPEAWMCLSAKVVQLEFVLIVVVVVDDDGQQIILAMHFHWKHKCHPEDWFQFWRAAWRKSLSCLLFFVPGCHGTVDWWLSIDGIDWGRM